MRSAQIRRLALLVAGAFLMAACADAGPGANVSPASSDRATSDVAVYEALIRHLAQPKPMPIHVWTDLCYDLLQPGGCPDKLSRDEQAQLTTDLADVGELHFLSDGDPFPSPQGDAGVQAISLSPIVEQSDGLRVEGGTICGNLCGHGAVYVVVPTASGYEVRGTDDSYGTWVS